MLKLKKSFKKIFYVTNTLWILDKINYVIAKTINYKKNKAFKKENPDFLLPPDYFLYETFQLNYQDYKDDGILSAYQYIEWTKPYLTKLTNILEWGCGVARIVRHIPSLNLENVKISGADINEEMIAWNKQNIPNIHFTTINYYAPTSFSSNEFDFIYALSVFTHIEADQQLSWVKEMHRILNKGGVFLFTTHGKQYETNLTADDAKKLIQDGVVTKSYSQKGHRMMTTYNTYKNVTSLIAPFFTILEYYDGKEHFDRTGGQDLWIVKKEK